MREPRGFEIVHTDWGSVRIIHTKAMGDVPELVWYFSIDNEENVVILHVEEYEGY
jgi:hypothetical protein